MSWSVDISTMEEIGIHDLRKAIHEMPEDLNAGCDEWQNMWTMDFANACVYKPNKGKKEISIIGGGFSQSYAEYFADTLANKLTELGYHVKVGPVLW